MSAWDASGMNSPITRGFLVLARANGSIHISMLCVMVSRQGRGSSTREIYTYHREKEKRWEAPDRVAKRFFANCCERKRLKESGDFKWHAWLETRTGNGEFKKGRVATLGTTFACRQSNPSHLALWL